MFVNVILFTQNMFYVSVFLPVVAGKVYLDFVMPMTFPRRVILYLVFKSLRCRSLFIGFVSLFG